MAWAYYNEIDPFAAEWLRRLIAAGQIAPGVVDERSIAEVQPDELQEFTQCHFFAGIGGWSIAARLGGWPDDRELWTGSCPCQPFSVAGLGRGDADERHLWPEFARLIEVCRPPVVAGEQVASKAGRAWLAGVRADLEALGYGVGGADLCAAGVGAPHIRQRLYWMADSNADRFERQQERDGNEIARFEASQHGDHPDGRGMVRGGMGDAQRSGLERHSEHEHPGNESGRELEAAAGPAAEAGGDCGPWSGVQIPCADGKARRIKPGIEPLVDGIPARVGRVRAYGNAIVPQLAGEFLAAVREVID